MQANEAPAPLDADAIYDIDALRRAARMVARAEVSDALTEAINAHPGSLRDLCAKAGLDPAFVSRLARGRNKQGGTVASLAQIALALGKSLKISIE